MTPEREKLLSELKLEIAERMDRKFRKGAEEHKENLLEKTDLLDEILDEIVDLCVYALVLKKHDRAS